MSLLRPRYVLPLAAVALLASACTGTTPAAQHTPVSSSTPSTGTGSPGGTSSSAPPTPTASESPSESATPAPPCSAAQLDVSLSSGGSAAGSTYLRLVFTNAGSAGCTLAGFPGVSLVKHAGGAPIGAPADRTGPGRTVTLDPGASARSTLQVVDAQNYPTDRCGQTPAHGLQVYPPNQTDSVFLPKDLLGCADQSVQILHVQAVHAVS